MKKCIILRLIFAVVIISLLSGCGNTKLGDNPKGPDTTGETSKANNNAAGAENNNNQTDNNTLNNALGNMLKSGKSEKKVSLEGLWIKIQSDLGTNLPEMKDAEDTVFAQDYGLKKNEVVQYVAKLSQSDDLATEIFLAEATKNSIDNIKAGIKKRQKQLEDKWATSLKEQYELVKGYRIEQKGDYILFVISSQAEKITDIFKSAIN